LLGCSALSECKPELNCINGPLLFALLPPPHPDMGTQISRRIVTQTPVLITMPFFQGDVSMQDLTIPE
jgi:hypothetical protein